MGRKDYQNEESQPLAQNIDDPRPSDEASRDSISSASTTSLVLEHLNHQSEKAKKSQRYSDKDNGAGILGDPLDVENTEHYKHRPADRKWRRIVWILAVVCLAGWILALVLFISRGAYKHSSTKPHDPQATQSRGNGKKITLDEVMSGRWYAKKHDITWIRGANGEDGLVLERNEPGKDYLIVEDVRYRKDRTVSSSSKSLMKAGTFSAGGRLIYPSQVWPSPDLKQVLLLSDKESNWRHSFTGYYWIFHVETQTAQPLDPGNPNARVQLASWSPQSDAVVFTRDNNMYLRKLASDQVVQITKDGGTELFYGIPDWVYEEEVFSGNSATWWSEDGKYVAFLRTEEANVPTYPIQYFVSRPSGKQPKPGLENYPEVREIKYPKAGAPNPVVHLQFYDVEKKEVFSVQITDDFPDEDRLITEIVWAGHTGKVLVRETNRESDILKTVLIDVKARTGRTVRTEDVNALDGGWFEVSEDTTFIPANPSKGRPHDGYIDTVIHDGYDHLAYFTPLENPTPILLTQGKWEVVDAPSAIDLENNLVYFISTKDGSIQRHIYSVKLDGTDLKPLTDVSKEGYYDVSFSANAGYALLSYAGPGIPWQKVISTPSAPSKYEDTIEENKNLATLAAQHELPLLQYSTINIEGFDFNVLERRPPHFDPKKKYPVLFFQYQGPGSQKVEKKFTVDFQSYVASSLGYIVVTVDGRGTGFIGRKVRVAVRGHLGIWEAHDQIEAGKIWANKSYVDKERMAIWGWSYGGFMALKTLEQDGGRTFKYGMAVAPVTDWRYYGKLVKGLHVRHEFLHFYVSRFDLHRTIYAYAPT